MRLVVAVSARSLRLFVSLLAHQLTNGSPCSSHRPRGAPFACTEAKRAPETPDYLHKEDYGRVPAYLAEVKAEIEEERELIEKMIAERDAPASSEGEAVARELSEDERAELLAALKAKWDLVNQRYQKMTHQAISSAKSTIGQVRLKETCERELDQLEKDIERLSVKGPIYVVD